MNGLIADKPLGLTLTHNGHCCPEFAVYFAGRFSEAANGGPRQQQIPVQKLYSIQCDRQAISAMHPGPAASVNRNPCNLMIAATILKPRPRPLMFRLLSER